MSSLSPSIKLVFAVTKGPSQTFVPTIDVLASQYMLNEGDFVLVLACKQTLQSRRLPNSQVEVLSTSTVV